MEEFYPMPLFVKLSVHDVAASVSRYPQSSKKVLPNEEPIALLQCCK